MALEVRQFPCLRDNYGFLVRDGESGLVATIDTPEARPILAALDDAGWRLDWILNTHPHPDHIGGNAAVRAATGAKVAGPAEVAALTPVDLVLSPGDDFELGATRFDILDTGGHTAGQIAYHDAMGGKVFVADALFALGCGKLLGGTAAQAFETLQRLAALPEQTIVYCAHEYSAANARFALEVGPVSEALGTRAEAIFTARARGEPTVPTTIGAEKAANPFLRAPDLETFTALRAAKDAFGT